jgi:diguanylate cyclase (GGDEF)-like protein/PAS domain S-box-containing protein
MSDLPETVHLAAEICQLDQFLDGVAAGSHWHLLDRMEDGVYTVDRERRIRYWSSGAQRITGYTATEALGQCCALNLLRHVDADGHALCTAGCPLRGVVEDGRPRAAEVFLHHKDGTRVPVRVHAAPIRNLDGKIIGAFETFSVTTSALAARERARQLERVALTDALTGVANRRCLEETLQARLSEFERLDVQFGVILADVDHFKAFNDRHGHLVGDQVLKTVAGTLALCCRPYDVVGRWGGEEFLVILGHTEAADLVRTAERLRALVAASGVKTDRQVLNVTVSAGATLVQPGDDAERLIERVDKLLYASKQAGRNRVIADCTPSDARTPVPCA